jgi:hypothetical protein
MNAPVRFVALAFALALSPHLAEAQQFPVGQGPRLNPETTTTETTETNRAPIIPFLEGTDVFWTLVKKDALDDGAAFFPWMEDASPAAAAPRPPESRPAGAAPPPPPVLELQSHLEARLVGEYEYHPRRWVDPQMRDIYGRHRLHVGGALAKKGVRGCRKRLEWSGDAFWNPGVVDPDLDWSGAAQVSCFPWMNGGWGLFARFYTGQDYYNVGFLDDISRLHVGLTFNQADFFRFRRRAQP